MTYEPNQCEMESFVFLLDGHYQGTFIKEIKIFFSVDFSKKHILLSYIIKLA